MLAPKWAELLSDPRLVPIVRQTSAVDSPQFDWQIVFVVAQTTASVLRLHIIDPFDWVADWQTIVRDFSRSLVAHFKRFKSPRRLVGVLIQIFKFNVFRQLMRF